MQKIEDRNKRFDRSRNGDIAIIGMSCIFPGAPDLRTYWQNIISKVDATGDPTDEWEAELYYDPASSENDRIYCKRGGYLGDLARFDPLEYGVMPKSIDGGEPDQFLALRVAYEALKDAGYLEQQIDRTRAEVIIGRGTYINRGFTTVVQHGLVVDQVLRILKQLHPEHSEDELQALKRELKASLPPFNAEMAPALVPNVMSGRIANRLDIMGPNYTVDAACASSMIAVDSAMQDLLSGRCDLAIVGGVHASTPAPILMIFCQLNALSRRGQIRPFDKDADGTLLGEGVGFIILKRREDAERDGDRIYALLKGVGTASDGRALGLLAPRVEGEELALRRAYEASGISPRTIELIEAHGTGTSAGDLAEIQSLRRVFGPRDGEWPTCAVGTVKSMISHLIPASGIAGLIKTALALYHKVLPPTLNCDEPNPKLELEKSPFYINTETRPWIHGAPTPRRAGVNAFGFGGINSHAILEEYTGVAEEERASFQHHWDTEVCVVEGSSREDLIKRCEELVSYLSGAHEIELKDLAYTLNSGLIGAPSRLAIVASALEDLDEKLGLAHDRLADPECTRIKDRSGIYFCDEPLSRQGKVAFLFPGEGSQYVNMLADLCVHFPDARAWFDIVDRAFVAHQRNYLPSQVIFPPPATSGQRDQDLQEQRLWQMDCGPEALFAANQAMFTLLSRLSIRPEVVAGHSTGEYSALFVSGANRGIDEERLIGDISALNEFYEEMLTRGLIPRGVMVAVGGADRDSVLSLVERSDEVYLAMDNCPHQLVLCGTQPALGPIIEHLQAKGAVCITLPFDRAYHTPLFDSFSKDMGEFLRRLDIGAPEIEMYSCTTAQPFPRDPNEIRKIAADQWARPVRFRETVEAMYEANVRIFVEVGPRNNLTAFVDDILRGRPYLAVASNVPTQSGITQLNHLVALLAAHDVPMRLDYLYARREPHRLSFDVEPEGTRKPIGAPSAMKLATGLQPLRLGEDSSRLAAARKVSSLEPMAGRSNGSASGLQVSAGDSTPQLVLASGSNGLHPGPEPTALRPLRPSLSPELGPQIGLQVDTERRTLDPLAHLRGPGQPLLPEPVRADSVHHQDGLRSQVMQEYFHTMERFLDIQKAVVTSYLNSIGTPTAEGVIDDIDVEAALIGDYPDSAVMIATSDAVSTPPVAGGPWDGAPSGVDQASASAATIEPDRRKKAEDGLSQDMGTPRPEVIGQVLLQLISERTGYPLEMLDLTLNLEADLGIDSIKRVEILGAFQQQSGLPRALDMDRLTSLKTIQQIIESLVEQDQGSEGNPNAASLPQREDPTPIGGDWLGQFPFLRTLTAIESGDETVATREIDLDEDIFLRDHTLGRRISTMDNELTGLPVVPLTVSMEMLAEVAGTLCPGKLLIGMRDIRAYRWIALDEGHLTVEIIARRKASASGDEVEVRMREATEPSGSGIQGGTPIIEGTMLFGDSYPDTPLAGEFPLRSGRPSKWVPERLYTEVMFHGPSLQGVASVDLWGEDGVEGTLRTLPTDRLFRSNPTPRFFTDPVLLDATGQLIGYWAAESFETGFHVFPFKVEAVHFYGPGLPPEELTKCRARIEMVGDTQTRSDIDVIAPDGRVLTQLVGWWDRRFDLPSRFYNLRVSPRDVILSTYWPAPAEPLSTPEAFACCFLGELSPDFLEAHGRIWQRVLAHMILGRTERDCWRSLKGPERRRTEWLLGRAAAKDAVRLILKRRYGLELYPADIEIAQGEHGQPVAQGFWIQDLERVPVLSIAHSEGIAVAVAGIDDGCRGIGIDIEGMRPVKEGFEAAAFTPRERDLLSSLDASREEWLLRLWCAKEAVAKALGLGMVGGPTELGVERIDSRTGSVEVALSGHVAEAMPHLAREHVAAYTGREGDIVFASSLI